MNWAGWTFGASHQFFYLNFSLLIVDTLFVYLYIFYFRYSLRPTDLQLTRANDSNSYAGVPHDHLRTFFFTNDEIFNRGSKFD